MQGHPHISIEPILGWKHADNRIKVTVKSERLTDHIVCPSESALPEGIRQYDDTLRILSRRPVAFVEDPTKLCMDTQYSERVGRVPLDPEGFRHIPSGERHTPRVLYERSIENVALLEIDKLLCRDRHIAR